ncbi:MAG TPA: hypothetical protein VML53_07420 [Thermoplasmata archaeon]|nr:hypothetical protein [Thermoplasmata archaeon]
MMVTMSAPGRATHVLMHYLPMIVLGFVFLIVGFSPTTPRIGVIPLGNLFLLLGVIMLVGAVLGMLFTRCEKDFVRWRIMCFHGRDVRPDPEGGYYRELVPDDPTLD